MDVQKALDSIAAEAARGDLVFATHTDVVLRVQRALDDPECSIEKLSKLICAEPVLSTKVVRVANSVAYNPAGQRISDIRYAVSRLGFGTLRALSASVAVRQMQGMSRFPAHRALAGRLWNHTAHVAALSRTIAQRVTRQDPETAFFAGIVHEVGGFYLLSRADHFPGMLGSGLDRWCGEIEAEVGRCVARALGVPTNVLEALESLWDGFLAMPPRTLGDTLLLADELSPVASPLAESAGMSPHGMAANIELLIDDKTLSGILADLKAEVASLAAALNS